MRGEIIQYSQEAGSGLISGEDGLRYSFTDEGIARREGLAEGCRVDFIGVDGVARDIYPLSRAGDTAAGPDYSDRPQTDLGLWGYFVKCMRLYFNGNGRARRKEYWGFMLFRAIFMLAIFIFGAVAIGMLAATANAQDYGDDPSDAVGAVMMVLFWILGLPFLAPHYAVSARRLHDVGLSGWLALLMLIPYAGGIFMFVIALIPSQDGRNAYGPYPIPRATPYPG